MPSPTKALPALAATALAAVLATGCGRSVGQADAKPRTPTATTVEDPRRGVSVTLPRGWWRAAGSLTPGLAEPREVLSVGSYPLRYEHDSACRIPGCPLPPLDGMGPGDVLVSLQERPTPSPRSSPAFDSAFPPRAGPFELEPRSLAGSGPAGRCARRKLAWWSWTGFADAGRAFYLFVAMGREASASTRRQLRRVLASIRFRPVRRLAVGSWRRLPPGQAAPGLDVTGVRAGGRAVFVAGAVEGERVEARALDPHELVMRPPRTAPLRWRVGASVVGTESHAIVWGGASNRGTLADGALFDVRGMAWRRLARSPLRRRAFHTAVWARTRMIVWGGEGGRRSRPLAGGATYDPHERRWRRIARAPLRPRSRHSAVWTGREMIVWGGAASPRQGGPHRRFAVDGAAYDPEADRWRSIPPAPLRSSDGARSVWTGRELLVWTGVGGARFDPVRNAWRRLPRAPIAPRAGFSAAWDGTRMIVWGGVRRDRRGRACGDCFLADGAAYRPATDSWRRLPSSPLAPRDRHAAVALPGGGMAVMGGCCRGSRLPFADGAVLALPSTATGLNMPRWRRGPSSTPAREG